MNKILDRNKYFSIQKKLYGIPLSSVPVYDYYVSKIGNDTSGDGSRLNPWQTLTKALTTIAIGGGKTIGVGDGLYQETVNCNRAFVSQVTVSGISKSANRVIIGKDTAITGTIIVQGSASNYRFEYLSVVMINSAQDNTIRIANSVNTQFYCCKFSAQSNSGKINLIGLIRPATAGTINGLLFQECEISQSGSDIVQGLCTAMVSGGAVINNVQFLNCYGSIRRDIISIDGGTNYLIDGGNFNCIDSHTIQFSQDGATSYSTTGIVQNVVINNIGGHALIMGRGCISGAIARNNTIRGGDYGLVIKMNANVLCELNNIIAGTSGGIYVKGATGAIVQDNVVVGTIPGATIMRAWSDGAGVKFGTLTCQRNVFTGSGAGTLILEWGDSNEDLGGGVNDYNTYTKTLSAALAKVRATSCTTLAAIQAAWSGYGDGSNDSHSIVN